MNSRQRYRYDGYDGHAIPLWLDRVNQCVLRGERPLKLTPKAFACCVT